MNDTSTKQIEEDGRISVERLDKLKSLTTELGEIRFAVDELNSNLLSRFSNMATFRLSEDIASLAKEKQGMIDHINDIKPALIENDINPKHLKNYILSGNNIGILTELYRITQEIGFKGMYESILEHGEESPYIQAKAVGSVGGYIADSILKFSSVLEKTNKTERTFFALYGEDDSNKISEHLSFVTSGGVLSLEGENLGVSTKKSLDEIQKKVFSSLEGLEIFLAKENTDTIDNQPSFPKAVFESAPKNEKIPPLEDILSSDPIVFGEETSSISPKN